MKNMLQDQPCHNGHERCQKCSSYKQEKNPMPQFRQENTAQYGTDTIRQAERHVHKTGIYKFSVTYGICHNACTPAGKRINQKEPAKFVKCIDQFIFPFSLFLICVTI